MPAVLNGDGDVDEPLDNARAVQLVRWILKNGETELGDHLLQDSLPKHNLTAVDVTNVLRCGVMNADQAAEYEKGHWRYRIHTPRMCVVIQFNKPNEMYVVTAWRKAQ
ncbi:MAG: hypothetical protein U0326_19975 [Polyangiales bacterium]